MITLQNKGVCIISFSVDDQSIPSIRGNGTISNRADFLNGKKEN